jgi:hypothetical protein
MVPIISTIFFDTLVFFAISYRMASIAMVGGTWGARVKSFVRGDGLYHLSKALLQSGQVYYLSANSLLLPITGGLMHYKHHCQCGSRHNSSGWFAEHPWTAALFTWLSLLLTSKCNGMPRIPSGPPRIHKRSPNGHIRYLVRRSSSYEETAEWRLRYYIIQASQIGFVAEFKGQSCDQGGYANWVFWWVHFMGSDVGGRKDSVWCLSSCVK